MTLLKKGVAITFFMKEGLETLLYFLVGGFFIVFKKWKSIFFSKKVVQILL